MVDRATNDHAPTVNTTLPVLNTRAGNLFIYAVPISTITDSDTWDSVTYSVTMPDGSAVPAWLTFDAATRTFSGRPDAASVGSMQFVLWGTDNYGASAGEYVTLNIAPNNAPVLTTPLADQTVANGLLNYVVPSNAFADSDVGDVLSYSATLADGSVLPDWLSFDPATMVFSGMPTSLGTISVRVTATDAGNLSASDVFDIAVTSLSMSINGTAGNDTLNGGVGDDTINGLAGNDVLNGNAGNDTLNGGTGADTMRGGLGNDTYVVDSVADVIIENLNEGMDSVQSSVSYTLAANVENLTLTGVTYINATGNVLDNVLTGNVADNVLDGGSGADTMIGGLGNDTYVVDNVADVIVENLIEGTDSVQSSVTYTLAANIENLTLTGTNAINATGNTMSNTLTGNAGDNVLDGGSGTDILYGGLGSDTYLFGRGSGQDTIFENGDLSGAVDKIVMGANVLPGDIVISRVSDGFGYDHLVLAIKGTTDSIRVQNFFARQDGFYKIEQVAFANGTVWDTAAIQAMVDAAVFTEGDDTINGYAWDDVLDGRGGNDTLYGWAGNDTLEGGAGNDTLYGDDYFSTIFGNDTLHGGAGNDLLVGGKGNDTYLFQRGDGIDTISDVQGSDKIVLGAGILTTDVSLFYDNGNRILALDGSSQTQLVIQENGIVGNQIEQIVFADGTIWNSAMIQSLTVVGTANAMVGTAGNDTFIVDNSLDTITEGLNQGIDTVQTSVSFNLSANVENMTATGYLNVTLVGNTLNNTITGNSGNNTLFGGGGSDTMIGGLGDDFYNATDTTTVIESANGGTDTVSVYGSFSTYTLQANVENLIFQSNYASTVSALGNALDNVITEQSNVVAYIDQLGRVIGDSIDGGAGADTMSLSHGGTYYVDNIGDKVAATGLLNVYSSVDFALPEFAGGVYPSSSILTLTGVNAIHGTGNGGANTLDGRQNSAASILEGGAGNDTYYAGANDIIVEQANGGIDTMIVDADPYLRLYYKLNAANVENLFLSTTYNTNRAVDLDGSDAANRLRGNAGFNIIHGLGGDDLIEGGSNTFGDVLDGGDGNDTIYGDGDLLGGAGNDQLIAGTGNDNLNGGDGNDTLSGGTGIDMLAGGTGNDVYVFNSGDGQDTIDDHDATVGNVDTIRFGAGIVAGNITFRHQGNDLVIGISGTTDQLTILNWGLGADYQIERVEFADGTAWDAAALNDMTVNHAPITTGVIANQSLQQGQTLTLDVSSQFTDADIARGDSLTFSVSQANGYALPSWLTFNAATHTFSGTPGNADVGTLNLQVTATDTGGLSASSNFAINIANVNDAPILSSPLTGQTGMQDTPFNYVLPAGTFIDADAIYGDVLHYSATLADGSALPAWLTFDAVTQSFSGTPGLSNIGSISVKVVATDTGGLAASGTYTLTVNPALPVIMGTAGNDTLTGTAVAEKLIGLAGNDTLNGGAGADIMLGGLGDDIYVVDNIGDVVTENAGEGIDTVQSSITYTLVTNVENLTLTGTAALNGTGNALDNILIGNSAINTLTGGDGNDTLNGGAGADKLIGGLGNDTYVVDNTGDVVTENLNEGVDTVQSSVTYTLAANVENLTLTGTTAINATGNALDNVLDGSLNTAANVLTGGAGNDTYILGTGDTIVEAAAAGTDTVMTAATYTLGTNLENLTLTGTAAVNGTGNTLNNVLVGNSAANTLSGGTGADTMIGGLGNDTYTVDNVGDIVTENLNEGTDIVNSSVTYTLSANVENLTLTGTTAINATGNASDNVLTGNTAANILTGGDGNDTLNGGTGADTMIGGLGNDTYTVDNVGDIVTENLNEGTDIVSSSVTYTLSANVENLTLTGTTAINGTGNASDNVLTGNSAVNTLTGGAGNDTLNGGAGADKLLGGLGNDIYIVDNTGDVITENLNEGTDIVQSSVTYTLAANVENLTLTGTTAINGTGNALDNILDGSLSTAANVLTGGAGNDTYVLGTGDTIVEAAAAGTDTVMTAATYTLATNLENLTLTGTAAVNGTGNTVDNVLIGNSAINTLTGGAGNDLLNGGLANDILNGDAGNDVLEGADGNDTLSDTAGNNLFNGGIGNDTMTGNTGNELFIGGTGNDTITTGTGADIVAFNKGDGQDIVVASTGADNTLSLGGGINYQNLALSKTGNDLILATGSGDQITMQNWFASTTNRSIANLQIVLDASTYNAGSTDVLLNQQVQSFNFATLAQNFDQAMAATPTLTSWSLTNALLNAHLAGSDTAALGGDLAYQYNLNGSLAGIGLASAQTELGNAGFGVSPQLLQPLAGLQTGVARLS